MGYTKLIVSKSVLVNLGDYQNEKVEMQLEYSIEPGETPEQAHERVSQQFKALLVKELEPTLERLPQWRREMWLDLLGAPKSKVVDLDALSTEPESDEDNPYADQDDEPRYEDDEDGPYDNGTLDDYREEDELANEDAPIASADE